MSESFTLAYGNTHFGKSTFLCRVIEHFFAENPESKIRLYTAEDYEIFEPWEKAGVLGIWPIDQRQEPFDTIALASMGYWPENPWDPTSKLLPPDKQKDWDKVKARMYEGLATFSDFCMGGFAKGGLAARSGRGEKIGASEETTSFKDGASAVGGNSRTHYNVTQKWIHGFVVKSRALPGHVIHTTHEVVAKDDRSNKLILGPEVVGTAATPAVPRWFGNCLHTFRSDRKVTKEGREPKLVSDYRIYLKPHYVEEIPNIPYVAGMRVPPEVQEEADKIIPDWIPNDKEAFAKIMEIRRKIDALSRDFIEKIRKGRAA